MRGLLLFARTRRSVVVLLVVVLTAAAAAASGEFSVSLNPTSGRLIRIVIMLPLAPALVIGAASVPSSEVGERSAARDLRWARFGHFLVCSLLAVVLLAAAVTVVPADSPMLRDWGVVSVVRNTLALTGLAYMCYRLMGNSLGWLLPLTWVVLPPLLVPRPREDPTQIFTLIHQPDSAFVPVLAAVLLWGAACALSLRR